MTHKPVVERISKYFIPFAASTGYLEQNYKRLEWDVDVSHIYAFYFLDHTGQRIAQTTAKGTSGLDLKVYGKTELVRFVDKVLDKAGRPQPRKQVALPLKTDRGIGIRKDGSARMAVSVRQRGEYGLPMFDSLVLNPDQLRALVPSSTKIGAREAIPLATARQFAPVLTLDSSGACKIHPEDLTVASLSAEITTATESRITVRLRGNLAGKGKHLGASGEGTVEGMLILNRNRQPESLLLVYAGNYQGGVLGTYQKGGISIEGIIEWQRSSAEESTSQ